MITIAFALEFESACFRARHDTRLRVGVWLLGAMGAGAAVNLRKKLEVNTPSLLISAGFAGGLQSELKVGDLVIGENFSDQAIAAKLSLGKRWRVGGVCTAKAILERAEDKRHLGEETGCLAGDLETEQLAEICGKCGVPILSVRCISDALEDDLPVPADVLLNSRTGRPDPIVLFRYLMRNPSCVSAFTKLLKNSRTAQIELASGLEEILPQLLRIA